MLHKQPSTPHDPSEALESGLGALLEREPGLRDGPVRIVHGTTIALNAVLQHKVAEIALVVSQGSRDVLEIARIRQSSPFNIRAVRDEPLVPRGRVFEVGARISAVGTVTADPTDEELDALCGRIAGTGVGAVAVMLLNAYVAPDAERAFADRIAARLPEVLVTRSAGIWPESREYERAVVACLNAQVHPLMQGYLSQMRRRVEAVLRTEPVIQLTSSAGGMLSIETAAERPIDTMLSGPASGATAAARICEAAGISAAISFDMGGTSADIAVIHDGVVEFTTKSKIGELPLMMPVVGVSSIGAGGGSIVSVDAYGVIKVGPESAGANPGPVAYGLGATRPTVTDCYLVLGFIDPDQFLGGAMPLDVAASRASLERVADRLGLPSAAAAAEAAIRVATARMATELYKLLAQRGEEPGHHFIVPFGGAGPTHAVLLAEEAGMAGIAVPPAAATFCALGAAMADVRREFVRGLGRVRVESFAEGLWENWAALETEASRWLAGERVLTNAEHMLHALDMRYSGQSFSITTEIPRAVREARDVAGVISAFHAAHERIYGFRESDEAVEAVTQRLSIIGEIPKLSLPDLPPGRNPDRLSVRPVFHRGEWIEAAIYRREQFGAGSTASGPAVVEQDDTCLWAPPGWRVTAEARGILIVTRFGS